MAGAFNADVYEVELTEWTEEESNTFVVSNGVPEQYVAPIYRACEGVPIWTRLILDVCAREIADTGSLSDPGWITRLSRERPAEVWLPKVFLSRLPRNDRAMLLAASTVRVLRREVVERLVDQIGESPDGGLRWDRLCEYSFVQTVRRRNVGSGERRIHALIRTAMIAAARRDSPGKLKELNVLAAEYFASIGDDVSEYYHRFAASGFEEWLDWDESIKSAIDEYEFDRATDLTEVVLGSEYYDSIERAAPYICGHAYIWRARNARARDAVRDALDAYEQALSLFQDAESAGHQVETLSELSVLEWFRGSRVKAEEYAARAIRIARLADLDEMVASLLERAARRSDDRSEAASLRNEALGVYREIEDEHGVARLLIAIALHDPNLDSSVRLLDEAYVVFEPSDCNYGRAEVRVALARRLSIAGDLDGASAALGEAYDILLETGDKEELADVLVRRAQNRVRAGDYRAGKQFFLDAIELCRLAKLPEKLARALRLLASASLDWEGAERALELIYEALATSAEIEDLQGIGHAWEALGEMWAKFNREEMWVHCKENYERALGCFETANDWTSVLRVLRSLAEESTRIAEAYGRERGVTDRRLLRRSYLERAFEIADLYRPKDRAELLWLLGDASFHLDDFAEARRRFMECLELGAPGSMAAAAAHASLGRVAFAADEFEEGLGHLQAARTIYHARGDRLNVAYALGHIGDAYLDRGQEEQAQEYFTESLTYFE